MWNLFFSTGADDGLNNVQCGCLRCKKVSERTTCTMSPGNCQSCGMGDPISVITSQSVTDTMSPTMSPSNSHSHAMVDPISIAESSFNSHEGSFSK